MEQLRVVLSGRVLPGFDASTVRTQLARLMRKEKTFAELLLAGKPTTVKSHVDATAGKRYVEALLAIGVECRLESEILEFDTNVGIKHVAEPPTKVAEPAIAESDSPSASKVAAVTRPAVDYGLFLVVLPVAASVLAWIWIGNMNLFEGPGSKLAALMVITILGTAIVAATEASKLGMVSDRRKGTYSPTAWFFIITFLWIVGYPAYLFKRRHYGLSNLLAAGLAITVVYVGSYFLLEVAIESRVEEVQASLRSNPSAVVVAAPHAVSADRSTSFGSSVEPPPGFLDATLMIRPGIDETGISVRTFLAMVTSVVANDGTNSSFTLKRWNHDSETTEYQAELSKPSRPDMRMGFVPYQNNYVWLKSIKSEGREASDQEKMATFYTILIAIAKDPSSKANFAAATKQAQPSARVAQVTQTPDVQGEGGSSTSGAPASTAQRSIQVAQTTAESDVDPSVNVGAQKADGYECHMLGSASFDCAKAKTVVERAICSNQALAEKDCLLGYVYRYSALDAASLEVKARITKEQRDWIKDRDQLCEKKPVTELNACLTQLTSQRALTLIKTYEPKDNDVFSEADFK